MQLMISMLLQGFVVIVIFVAVAGGNDVDSTSPQPIQHKKTKSPRKNTVVDAFLRNEGGQNM